MVLEGFFQDIVIKTQIPHMKYMFSAIFDDFNNKNKIACGLWGKIGV